MFNFVRISIGGPLLGLVVGIACTQWLKRILNNDVLIANITFVSCYTVFYIAEFTWVRVSGILSVVCLGLYMSAIGKTKVFMKNEHTVHTIHTIWTFIQYVCETIIFLLTGVIVGV